MFHFLSQSYFISVICELTKQEANAAPKLLVTNHMFSAGAGLPCDDKAYKYAWLKEKSQADHTAKPDQPLRVWHPNDQYQTLQALVLPG